MIGANAAAAELAVQMLDKFDLQGWTFSGSTDSTTQDGVKVRVIVTPPMLPAGCSYAVLVKVDDDANFGDQVKVAVDNLMELLTTAAPYEGGTTPDSALDGFFQQLNLPEQVALARKQEVEKERHPEEQAELFEKKPPRE